MSKTIRIRDHLHAEIERLAKLDRRSMVAQVELLLEQALRMRDDGEEGDEAMVSEESSEQPSVGLAHKTAASPSPPDDAEVRTDFK